MSTILHTIKSIIPTGKKGPPPPEDLFDLKKEYHRIRDELRQARVTNKDYHHELRRRTGELRQANRDVGHLQQECQRLKKSIKGLQNDLNNVHQQLEDAKTLSEVREKKLISAQIDTISISEVGEKVTALNEEIFQAAAILGEALVYNRQELSQRDLNAASAVSHEAVGEKMTNLLITRSQKSKPEINPLLVQVVLEILMVNFCISKIQSWYPGDSTIGEFLSAIYSGIHSTEKQEVSGRWRALTRAHTRPSTETWKKELYQKLQSVLKIASWTAPSDSPEVGRFYGRRLPSTFKAINELRIAIGEKFTSANLDIFRFECDTIYDPANMDDAYGDTNGQFSGRRAPEAIVGTTGVGLKKIIAERSAKDVLPFQTLIPAKTVLWSTLNEALEPTRANRKKLVENTDGANQDGRD